MACYFFRFTLLIPFSLCCLSTFQKNLKKKISIKNVDKKVDVSFAKITNGDTLGPDRQYRLLGQTV